MIGSFLILFGAAAAPAAVADTIADPAPFASDQVPDPVLAELRGGIRLPNGIDVALSIDTLTAVNGAIVLQTVVKIDKGSPVITVYAPADGQSVAAPNGAANAASGLLPMVTYDRQHGIQIVAQVTGPAISFSHANSAGTPVSSGLNAIDPIVPVQTGNGVITAIEAGARRGVELSGPDIQITHLTGNAFGSVIANSGSDRAIDTRTTIDIDLRNAGPDILGSTAFRVENIAIEAMSTRF